MEELKFNLGSERSQKARIKTAFDGFWIGLLVLVAIVLLGAGVGLLALNMSIGWTLFGISAVPTMVFAWYRGELYHLPIKSNPKTIDDALSGTVLGRLPKQLSPKDLATIIGALPGGRFFAVRFGIGPNFLSELASTNSTDMQTVWHQAWDIWQQTKTRNISDAVLLVALIKATPNYETLLNHLQLDMDDLNEGLCWYNHLKYLVEQHRLPRRTGGVGRDWSFGWTPLLNRFGQNISRQAAFYYPAGHELIAHKEQLDQLVNILSKQGRRNAVLVAQSGAGKTELVRAFASRLMDGNSSVPKNLRYNQVVNLDSSALIAAAPDRGGLEQLVPKILGEAYAAKNIIICLDNAQLFFEDSVGAVDVTNVLMPILEAGNLRMILTVDEQKFLEISRRNSEVVNFLNRIVVPPANREETIHIMQEQVITIEHQTNTLYMYQALVEAYRLGDRYVHDRAMPGKAIKLLESASHYADNGLVTADSVRQSIEKTSGIKVGVANRQDERDKLLNLEDIIHKRMINQTKAVSAVSDALRRARAGVRNTNRPIGTFLFLGPTGVGKTELAKSLAATYFDGEDRIIRLDMNEYVSPNDVDRLIADGADNPNSLTARAIKQPFSVVLLDEIEKAHPNVLSTLLQMLDEGVLRDIKNREVSFCDAIIIATSNAGSDRIREYIDRGYDIQQFEEKFINELIDSKQFLPEFLNRFDEIVMFRPLKPDELIKVVDLMIAGLNKNLALQKISVSVDEEAKHYLVQAGYDPRLGARPMRRVIQRVVENSVAKQLLSGGTTPGTVINITSDIVKQSIDAKSQADTIAKSNT